MQPNLQLKVAVRQQLKVKTEQFNLQPMVVGSTDLVKRGFAKRLGEACDAKRLESLGRPAWLARELKISVTAAQKYFSGDAMPKGSRWQSVADTLQVNVQWLRDGIGPMQSISDELAKELWGLWPALDANTRRDLVGAARVKAKKTQDVDPFQATPELPTKRRKAG